MDGSLLFSTSAPTPLKFEHNAFIASGNTATRGSQRFNQSATIPLKATTTPVN
eukprot:Ihof_evm4s162 gene=Ihof_evmTU4s162